ncbi:hypothetical protein DFH27DRAFT_526264 [Peziza echinospora]|nr:hypothetical protein DFH27DRAFT_526264 [Peziza echinospora]
MPTAQGIRCQVFACTTKNPHNRVIKHSDDLLSEYTCPADSSKLREGVAPPSLLPAPPQHEYHSYVNLTQAGDRPLYIEVDPTTFDWGDCTSLMAEFYMDGVKIGKGKTFHSSISWMSNPNKVISFYRTSFIKRVYGEQDQEVTAELRFGNLKHDDESDDTPKPVRDDTNMLGEITVKIYRFSGGQCERRQRRLPKNLPMLPSQANITERDVKGKGISHLINLGDIQTSTYKFRDHGSGSRSYHLARTQPKDINRPFLTFIFKYRTQEHLECLGLISKPPQPSNDVPVRVGRPVKIEDTTQKTENTEQKVKNDKCDDTQGTAQLSSLNFERMVTNAPQLPQVAESGQTKSGPATQSGVKRKSTGTGHTCDGEPSQKTVKMDGPGSSAENPIILKLEGPGSSAKYPIVFKMEGQVCPLRGSGYKPSRYQQSDFDTAGIGNTVA